MISQASLKVFGAALLCACFTPMPHQEATAAEPGAAATAVEDHPAGAGHDAAKESPVDLKLDLGAWSLLVFVVLLIVLRIFAWGPLMEGLEAREKHIRDEIAEAEAANAEAKRLLAEHEKKMAEVQNEVRAILDEARRDAQHTQQEIMKQAQSEAHATRDRAVREIEQARDQALQELFHRAADAATEMAAQIVHRSLNPQDHRDLVAKAMKELPSQN